MKKAIIYQFDPAIYPMKLWVSITTDFKSLSERFCNVGTKTDIDTSFIDQHEAACYYVQQKEKPTHYGILIATTAKSYLTTKLIAHESTHGADFIWQHTGERRAGDEANAYLVGWIAECIEKVKLNKL
jgi:hypothetical protein